MGLDVAVPDPPRLESNASPDEYEDVEVVAPANYRRDDLEAFLREGAWDEAWERWAADTELTAEEYAIVADLGLIHQFDFFWDDFADRVGYHAPGLPENWREQDLHPDLKSWATVSSINASLTELGQVVCEVLKADYVDWEAEFEPPEDLPDF